MAEIIKGVGVCPHCKNQLQIESRLVFASGPRSSEPQGAGDLESLLNSINDDELSGAAEKFVRETRERFEKYGPRTKMSEKQLAWLGRIAAGETGNEW